VRDSDRIIGLLDSKTAKVKKGERMEKHLLITRFDAARAARGEMLAIEDVLEILSLPLIIPESEAVLRASNLGTPVTICSRDIPPAIAYAAAARRLAGEVIEMTIPTGCCLSARAAPASPRSRSGLWPSCTERAHAAATGLLNKGPPSHCPATATPPSWASLP
jgi:hypothetical protein